MLQEFRRHKSALGAAQDRATLMSGASERSSLLGANAQSTSSALLRERGQIGGAHQAVRLGSALKPLQAVGWHWLLRLLKWPSVACQPHVRAPLPCCKPWTHLLAPCMTGLRGQYDLHVS